MVVFQIGAKFLQSLIEKIMINLKTNSKLFIAGHQGLVGTALVKYFLYKGFTNLLLRKRDEVDLNFHEAVWDFLIRNA